MALLRKQIWIFALLLAGCATNLPRALEEIRPGMDKDRVLEIAGNPKQSFRENGQDRWLYQYFNNDKEWKRELIFDDGKVVRVTRPLGKEEWVKELERSGSMEEYEQKARAHQKKASNFKSIDGETDSSKGK